MLGVLLASAYPDRIARLRADGDGYQYQLSNGRSAVLPREDGLVGTQWLAVAELGGQVGEPVDRIYSASALNPQNFDEILSILVTAVEHVEWDYRKERFIAERRSLVGSILLSSQPLEQVSEEARAGALLGMVRKKGLGILPWSKNLQQWRARVMLLHRTWASTENNPWPDLSDAALLQTLEYVAAALSGSGAAHRGFPGAGYQGHVACALALAFAAGTGAQAPERWAVPSGSSVAIDYSQDPPVLAVKLQEMFGCEETPTIADGRVALLIHLLSPGQHPLQITQDLAGFWRSGYQDVKREMKGRYPKHPWPDDPLQAVATRHTKKRAGSS